MFPLTFATLRWTLANLNREWWSFSSPDGILLVLLHRTLVAEKIFSCWKNTSRCYDCIFQSFHRFLSYSAPFWSCDIVRWFHFFNSSLAFGTIGIHYLPSPFNTPNWRSHMVTHFEIHFHLKKRTFLWAGLHDITSFQSDLLPCRTTFHTFVPHWFQWICHILSWRSYPLSMHGQELKWYKPLWSCDTKVEMDSTQGYSLASWLDFQCLCWTSWWLSLPTPWSSPACQSLAWHCEIMGFSAPATSIVDAGKCKGHRVGQGDVGLHCFCSGLRLAWLHDTFWCWVSFSMVIWN